MLSLCLGKILSCFLRLTARFEILQVCLKSIFKNPHLQLAERLGDGLIGFEKLEELLENHLLSLIRHRRHGEVVIIALKEIRIHEKRVLFIFIVYLLILVDPLLAGLLLDPRPVDVVQPRVFDFLKHFSKIILLFTVKNKRSMIFKIKKNPDLSLLVEDEVAIGIEMSVLHVLFHVECRDLRVPVEIDRGVFLAFHLNLKKKINYLLQI